ncbi:MAG: GntR family transcriptional regulator [Desulfohalobiaceae bacterium]|nr:GntR family transcriptional regulator [Desulfohalobiaceae bacterium]
MSTDLTKALRERIIQLDFRPGSPLNEKKLAAEFKVSRTPIREALIRLSQENLVTLSPHSVARVADVNLQDFQELIQCRLVLERGVARLATINATQSDIQELERLEKTSLDLKPDNPAAFVRHDSKLHQVIRRAAANSFMDRYLENIQNHFTRIQYLIGHRPDNTKMHQELLQVIKALKERDQETLVDLCVDHVQRFVAVVRNHFKIY